MGDPMDHAEALDRLEDALLGSGRLEALGVGDAPEQARLRDHLAVCPSCRAELGALQATAALLAAAAPDDLRPPAATRERVIRAVRETGVKRPRSSALPAAAGPVVAPPTRVGPSRHNGLRWTWHLRPVGTTLAAAVAIVLLGGGVLFGANLVRQRDAATAQVAALTKVAAWTDRLLAAPDRTELTLRDAQGRAAGTVVFSRSSGDLVVFSEALDPTSPRETYDCYITRNGQWTRIGWMNVAGSVSYWVGKVPAGSSIGQPGDRFVVLVDRPGATPELSATF